MLLGKKSTEKNSILSGYKFPQGNTDLIELKEKRKNKKKQNQPTTQHKKTPTDSEPCQELSFPGGSVSVAFTSGMVTNYKMGLLLVTTDVLNDKLSVWETKGYQGISTKHTLCAYTHTVTKISPIWFQHIYIGFPFLG